MNIRRLMASLFVAAALLPLAPAHAQNGSPFDAPTPGFGGGGLPAQSSGGLFPGQAPPAAPPPQSPLSPPAALSRESFTEILAAGAFHQHPRPPAWGGSSAPTAGSLPVSNDMLTLTLYGRETLQGVVEARIATGRGIFYMIDTVTGAQTVAADAITSVAVASVAADHRSGRFAPPFSSAAASVILSRANPFAAENARMQAQESRTSRARLAAEDHQANLRVAAENRALLVYAHTYPGRTSGHGTRPTFTHSSVRWSPPASGGGFATGPGDGGGHDYARAVGGANDPVLSTGWTSGHGARAQHVRDYYRRTKSGGLSHVHSYYRRHR